MKSSTVLASLLFGSFAVAAPLNARGRLTKTVVVTQTVYSTTTVYDDEPTPTSSQGLFYEQPQYTPSAAPASSSSSTTAAAPVNTPYVPAVPSPQPQPSSPTPAASSAPPVTPQPSSAAPAPAPVIPSAAPAAPAPVASAAPQQSQTPPQTSGQTYTNVDMTVYDGDGGKGACSTDLDDTKMFVALSYGIFGDSTYDRMTGNPTNPWCTKSIAVTYNGKTLTMPVVDRCAGCNGPDDIDISRGAWAAFGLGYGDRLKASWSVVA